MAEKLKSIFNKDIIIFGLLITVGLLIYINALNAPFIWDDFALITGNEQIRSFSYFKEWFTTSTTSGNPTIPTSDLYRPLIKLIHATIYGLFGAAPLAFRMLNIVLHILNSLFVFVLLGKIKLPRYGSLLGALIFLTHPVQVETVTYISGLPDVLVSFFILLGLLFFQSEKNFLALAMCIFGFLSKEIAITFFAFAWLLTIYEWKIYDKKSLRKKFEWLSIFMVVTLIYIILKFTVLNFTGSVHLSTFVNEYTENISVRIITFISILWEYAKLIIFPKDLFFEKVHLPVTELFQMRGIFGVSFIIGGCALAYNSFFKSKRFFFAFVWFFIPLIPVSGIFIIANNLYAERWLYLPLIAITFGIASFWETLKTKQARAIYACLMILIAVALSIRTVYRNFDWTDPERFYEKEISYNPYSPRLYSQLGTIHFAKGNYNRAIQAFEKSVITDDIESSPIFRFNLGNTYYYVGKYDKAEYWLKEALRMKPDYEKAKKMLDKTISDHERFK